MVEMDRGEFRKKCPHLWRELEGNVSNLTGSIEEAQPDKFRGYTPTAVDYLRRCDTREQAEKTITHLEDTKEITSEYAEELRRQLRERGLGSFGLKKKEGFYLREAGLV